MCFFYFAGGRALARRHGQALKGATRDPLTDLGNHSMFREELNRAVAHAIRRQQPMALALIDLDDGLALPARLPGSRPDQGPLPSTAQVPSRIAVNGDGSEP
jgi:Diguanylate cyclase, GGDEF domain